MLHRIGPTVVVDRMPAIPAALARPQRENRHSDRRPHGRTLTPSSRASHRPSVQATRPARTRSSRTPHGTPTQAMSGWCQRSSKRPRRPIGARTSSPAMPAATSCPSGKVSYEWLLARIVQEARDVAPGGAGALVSVVGGARRTRRWPRVVRFDGAGDAESRGARPRRRAGLGSLSFVAGGSARGWWQRGQAGERGGERVRPRASCVAGAGWRGGRGRPAGRRCAAAGSAASWVRSGELAVERERWVQAIRSWAISESSSQTALWSKSRKGRLSRPVCLAARMRSSALARARCRRSSSTASPVEVGQGGQEAVAVVVGEGQLRAGVRALAAHDHARALGPAGEVEAVGDLGDPGAVARLAVLADRRPPRRFGQPEDRLAHRSRSGRSRPGS